MTAVEVAPSSQDTGSGDDLLHTVCSDCDPDTALCGARVPGDCWTSEGLECVVCDDLCPAHQCEVSQ